jgi:hypothetical protein
VLEGFETDKRYGGSCLLRKNTQKDGQRDTRNERKAGGLTQSSGVLRQQRRSEVLVCEEYDNR